MRGINYSAMAPRIKSTLNPWQRYGLTPYGRIHVIKSELMSQLIYMMTVLPAPDKAFCKEIEKTMGSQAVSWGIKFSKWGEERGRSRGHKRGKTRPVIGRFAPGRLP